MTTVTRAFTLAVQDLAVETGGSAASIALYGWLAGEPLTPVVRAAQRLVGEAEIATMSAWIETNREHIAASAAALDAAAETLGQDPLTPVPSGAAPYRAAAEELALADGENCAAIAWFGATAEARWVRLYGGRIMEFPEALTDPVCAAAVRELGPEECLRIANAVNRAGWARIDERASASSCHRVPDSDRGA